MNHTLSTSLSNTTEPAFIVLPILSPQDAVAHNNPSKSVTLLNNSLSIPLDANSLKSLVVIVKNSPVISLTCLL